MLDIATISESVNNAAHEFPIKRVDLFGSYAEERQVSNERDSHQAVSFA